MFTVINAIKMGNVWEYVVFFFYLKNIFIYVHIFLFLQREKQQSLKVLTL